MFCSGRYLCVAVRRASSSLIDVFKLVRNHVVPSAAPSHSFFSKCKGHLGASRLNEFLVLHSGDTVKTRATIRNALPVTPRISYIWSTPARLTDPRIITSHTGK